MPNPNRSAQAAGVVRAAAACSTADNKLLEVFRRTGVVRVLVWLLFVIIHGPYPKRIIVRTEDAGEDDKPAMPEPATQNGANDKKRHDP
jgi:hypothetical protein